MSCGTVHCVERIIIIITQLPVRIVKDETNPFAPPTFPLARGDALVSEISHL